MSRHLILQVMRFGTVGLSAALAHFSIVILLVEYFNLNPLVANIFAFLVAFQVGYIGHRYWTFRGTVALHKVAFSKMFILQMANLAANEGLFYVFIAYFHLSYPVALFFVLAILPIFTFTLSKFWIFQA